MYCKSLSLFFVSLLVGCGGGGSGGGASITSSNGDNSATVNTLSIMAKYKDSCGNETPASDAALLIHNSDYSNKEIIYADANGLITYKTEQANQTLSILMRGAKDEVNGINPMFLATYIDQPVVDMGDYYQYTGISDACQCQLFEVKVNVPSRINDIGRGSISGVKGSVKINNDIGYTNFTGLSACKDSTGTWPLIATLIDYNYPEQALAALIPDISTVVETSAELEGTVVNINTNHAASTQVSTVIDGKYRLRNYSLNSSDNVYGFATDAVDFYAVSAYHFESVYDIPNVDDAFIWTLSSENSTNLNKTFDLLLTDIDYISLFDVLVSDSGQYDLSYVPNMDYITVGVEATYNNETVLNWMLFAPISGEVPKIENIDLSAFIAEDTLDASVDRMLMYIDAQGYDGVDGYQDYMNSRLERTLESRTLDKWSRFDSIYLEVTLSNFDAISTSKTSLRSKASKQPKQNEVANKVFDKLFEKESAR